MKKVIFTILFIIVALFVNAQTWHTDLNKAQKISKEKKRNLILVFQGSDWCAPCMKLEQNVWESSIFKDYAKENYVLVKVKFPKKRKNKLSKEQQKKNDELAEKYNKNGVFPLVVVLDEKGKVIGKISYKNATPEQYLEKLNSL